METRVERGRATDVAHVRGKRWGETPSLDDGRVPLNGINNNEKK